MKCFSPTKIALNGCLAAILILFGVQCAQPVNQGYHPGGMGNRVEQVERMGPVDSVPYTGDTEYIHAAQRYTTESRYGRGWDWGPW